MTARKTDYTNQTISRFTTHQKSNLSVEEEAIYLKMVAVREAARKKLELKKIGATTEILDKKLVKQSNENLQILSFNIAEQRQSTQKIADELYEIRIGIENEQESVQENSNRFKETKNEVLNSEFGVREWVVQVDDLGKDISTSIEEINNLLVDLQQTKKNLTTYKEEYREQLIAATKAKREAEAKAKREAKAKAKREAEAKAKKEAEARAKREAKAKAKREAEAKAKREAKAKAKKEAEAKAKKEAEAKAKKEAEAKAKREAEAKAKREAEAKAKREVKAKAKREVEAKAKREAEAKAKREAEAKAKREAETKAKREAEAKVKREAETKAKREAEAKAKKEAAAEAKREAAAKAKRKAEVKAKLEAIAKREAEAKSNFIKLEMQKCPQNYTYLPSSTIEEIFNRHITIPIKEDTRTDWHTKLLGYDNDTIRRNIIEFGRADFGSPYKDLSPSEKVLLYCYYNMKKHYFSSYSLFERLKNIEAYFSDNLTPLVIDIGCGPGTSLLALGDYIRTKTNNPTSLNYVGIDIASSMCEKASEFSNATIFSSTSNFEFYTDWDHSLDHIKSQIEKTNIILINASYLFASESLDVGKLGAFINTILTHFNDKPIYFLFQNPDKEIRNNKYFIFKQIVYKFDTHFSNVDTIKYQTTRRFSQYAPKTETVKIEVLSNIKI